MARLLFTGFLALVAFLAKSQELTLVSNAGGFYTSENFSLSWSLGESLVETYTSDGVILTQGFQQSLLNPVGIFNENPSGNVNVQVYPNPTRGKVFINVISNKESIDQKDITCTIYDLLGNQISMDIMTFDEVFLDFTGYPESLYFLNIKGNKFQHTVIIQKLN